MRSNILAALRNQTLGGSPAPILFSQSCLGRWQCRSQDVGPVPLLSPVGAAAVPRGRSSPSGAGQLQVPSEGGGVPVCSGTAVGRSRGSLGGLSVARSAAVRPEQPSRSGSGCPKPWASLRLVTNIPTCSSSPPSALAKATRTNPFSRSTCAARLASVPSRQSQGVPRKRTGD